MLRCLCRECRKQLAGGSNRKVEISVDSTLPPVARPLIVVNVCLKYVLFEMVMKLSAKSRYASRILLDLALHNEGRPQRVSDISERTGITVPFIEQIIKPLKQAGMVASKRGASGGHQLNLPPERITLGEIVRLMEGSVELSACLSDSALCDRSAVCLTRVAWQRGTDAMLRELDAISLAELVAGAPNCCQLAEDSSERKR